MILGSHNSWSYLPPKKWWMWPFTFMAKCQSVPIKEQYDLGVRCFDLRIRHRKDGRITVAHGAMEYNIDLKGLCEQLEWLNARKDVSIRVIHEVRRKSQYTEKAIEDFQRDCRILQVGYPFIKFWGGRNLYNWKEDFSFKYKPSCMEKYSSVCLPKVIDDWWPWLYAKTHNRKLMQEGTEKNILMIDFINIR